MLIDLINNYKIVCMMVFIKIVCTMVFMKIVCMMVFRVMRMFEEHIKMCEFCGCVFFSVIVNVIIF